MFTVRAQPSIWWLAENGGTSMDSISDVAAATGFGVAGRVYVTGWQTIAPGVTQWVITAYQPGNTVGAAPIPVWDTPVMTWAGPWPGEAKPHALVVMPQIVPPGQPAYSAALLVVGQAPGPDGTLDFITLRLDLDTGERLMDWPAPIHEPDLHGLRRYVGPANGIDIARDVTFDYLGNIYVVGPSEGLDAVGMSSGLDYAIIKYDPSGHHSNTWPATASQPHGGVRRYNGPGNGDDEAIEVVAPKKAPTIVTSEWIYVGGTSWGGASSQRDVAVLQINLHTGEFGIADPDTAPGWGGPVRFHRPGATNDYFAEMVLSGGQLFVAATSEYDPPPLPPGGGGVGLMGFAGPTPNPSPYDYTTFKLLETTPQVQWARYYDGPANLTDTANGIAVGGTLENTYVYVVGSSQGLGAGSDVKVVRYTTDGDPTGWGESAGRFDGLLGDDSGFDVQVREAVALYAAGSSVRPTGGTDFIMLKFDLETGALRPNWPVYFGTAGADDAAIHLRLNEDLAPLDGRYKFVVGGWGAVPGRSTDIITIQFKDDE